VTRRGAAFIDRDGVIDELVADSGGGPPESPLHVADVRLVSGAAAALRRLSDAGWRLVGVSNQPAAAKGTISLGELHVVHARVIELLASEGVRFDDFRLCLHHPDGVVPELTGPCDCRKPAPGMLRDAARAGGIDLSDSWLVGDTDADVGAGRAAGVRVVLVTHPGSGHKRGSEALPDALAADLGEAADLILGRQPLPSAG
jgi:D-glycero-D-manno-heptose 1,7-bisphosphate phosphatase